MVEAADLVDYMQSLTDDPEERVQCFCFLLNENETIYKIVKNGITVDEGIATTEEILNKVARIENKIN